MSNPVITNLDNYNLNDLNKLATQILNDQVSLLKMFNNEIFIKSKSLLFTPSYIFRNGKSFFGSVSDTQFLLNTTFLKKNIISFPIPLVYNIYKLKLMTKNLTPLQILDDICKGNTNNKIFYMS